MKKKPSVKSLVLKLFEMHNNKYMSHGTIYDLCRKTWPDVIHEPETYSRTVRKMKDVLEKEDITCSSGHHRFRVRKEEIVLTQNIEFNKITQMCIPVYS